jgi:hypothetical protein
VTAAVAHPAKYTASILDVLRVGTRTPRGRRIPTGRLLAALNENPE